MSEEPPLERSVLERKERGELHAIADSLGLNPSARLRKSELIDRILEATGAPPPAAQPALELVAVGAGEGAEPVGPATVAPVAAASGGADPPAGSGSADVDAPSPAAPAPSRANGESADEDRRSRPSDGRGAERA